MSTLITDPRRFRLPIIPESTSPQAAGGASQRGSHRLAEIATCKRKWFFRWVWKIVSHVRPKYFVEGELCHLQLAYYFAERMQRLGLAVPNWYTTQPLGDVLIEASRGYPELIPMSYAFIQSYALAAHGDRWTSIGVEAEFAATIGDIRRIAQGPDVLPTPEDGQTVTARIDLVAVTNGMIWLVDHKGVGRVSKHGTLFAWNDTGEYAIRWQFYVQLLVVRAALARAAVTSGEPAPDVGGVVVQRFGRTPPYDVDANVAPFHTQIAREAADTIQTQVRAEADTIADIQAAQARGEDMETWLPTPSLWSCFEGGFRACDYRSLCLTDRSDKGAWRSVLHTEYRSV